MSRETDSPSSGPNGRGGAAYPSGTPPYGTPVVSDGGTDAGRSAGRPEERKTETTLTTRIRINIPGSRPIPPVVVRKTVADAEGDDTAGTDAQQAPASGPAGASGASGDPMSDTGAFELPPEPAPAAEEKTSDWFAPRKSGPAKGGQGGGSTNGAGMPGGSAAGSGAPAPGASAPGSPRPAPRRPGGVVGSMSAPGSRPGGTNGAGLPGGTNGAGLPGGATGGPVAPGHGGGTGSFDVTEALAAGPLGNSRPGQGQGQGQGQGPVQGRGPGQGQGPAQGQGQGLGQPQGPGQGQGQGQGQGPGRDNLPYFSDNGRADQHGFAGPQGPGGPGGMQDFNFNGPDGPSGPLGQGGPQGPAGPTGGPVTGAAGPMAPPAAPNGYAGPRTPAPGAGNTAVRLPGGGLSDDTAVLTPQKQVPEPGPGGYGRPVDNVSGHTLTSGIPVVPAGPGTGTQSAAQAPPKAPAPAGQNANASSSSSSSPSSGGSKKKKKKGRSKLVLLGGLLVVAGVGVYGAGLLMNHSDVPKGTSVLGVDIGGGTRDDAVKKLDDAFDKRIAQPLKLSVGGDTVSLKPDQAGLQFDIQATVDGAAKADYNPVSVVGSLFGQQRVVEPEMPVDEEKLQAALQSAAGGSGTATDGTIKFESGKAVAVYGKAGKGIDAAKAADAVVTAYRNQVATGGTIPVQVPTTTKQPTITDAEVDRMMKEFAEPAMSGTVTVETDAVHSVPLSPQNSLWKFLGVKAIDGKLVESYDKEALKELYGNAFDGVLIARGTGQKTAVTVEDVIGALRPALVSKTDRTGVIDTDPS
ncbi:MULTISPECIES: hypothetical protein [Streptomyces]|uniref:Peptidoglycan binding domain-containing protein n=2 Tax=Streptomyces TaxID=1883 RepID=A0ABV9IHK4_9ACTN